MEPEIARQGPDVHLALQIARSVHGVQLESGKTHPDLFALRTGTTADRVLRHLAAWDVFARRAGLPRAIELVPDGPPLDLPPDAQALFRDGFDARRSGGRPRASIAEIVQRMSVDPDYRSTLKAAIEASERTH